MKSDTEKHIRQAITRIEQGRTKVVSPERKLSITSAAEEAGIHRSTIINRYPILAELIKEKSGSNVNKKSSEKQRIIELENKLSEAKTEISSLKERLAKVISLQATISLK